MKERLYSLSNTNVNSKLLPKIIKNREVRNGHNITSNKVIDEESGIYDFEKIKIILRSWK